MAYQHITNTDKVRINTYIRRDQDDKLGTLMAITGMSRAELIRRAIDRFVKEGTIPYEDLVAHEEL